MKRSSYLITLCLILFYGILGYTKDGDPDISEEKRRLAAEEKLKNSPDKIAIYVKGLVCSSCSLGIRVHLRKLKGIDKKQLKQGVDLDVDTQLVTVMLSKGQKIPHKSIAKAIKKAGYEAQRIYYWNGQSLISQAL